MDRWPGSQEADTDVQVGTSAAAADRWRGWGGQASGDRAIEVGSGGVQLGQ